MRGSTRRRCGLGIGLVLACLVLPAGPARAGDGSGSRVKGPAAYTVPGGYAVQVSVSVSGDGASRHGVQEVPMPPTCAWVPAPGAYRDAAAMLAWYDSQVSGAPTRWQVQQLGPRQIWVDAVQQEKAGRDLTWYRATCQDAAQDATFTGGCVEYDEPGQGPRSWVCYPYKAFPADVPPPPPLVAPRDLATAVRNLMVIPEPTFDHNPKVATLAAATLVGLPTWFWVVDPAATGGSAGTRTIRAEAGPVWAEVVARTSGLELTSPGGSVSCTPGQARTAWQRSTPEASGCTLVFRRASVGYPAGYPVTASVHWTAQWTGSGNTGGTLDPVTRSWTGNVPVAEVQTIVSAAG